MFRVPALLLWVSILLSAQTPLVVNGGFELQPGIPGSGWSIDAQIAGKGTATLSTVHVRTGQTSLKLVPNSSNTMSTMAGDAYGVAQGIAAASLAGTRLYLTGWMKAEGGATAVIRVYEYYGNGSVRYQEVRQVAGPAGLQLRRDIFPVAKTNVLFLVVMCLVEGRSGAVYFDDVALSTVTPADWSHATGTADPGPALDATVTVDTAARIRRVPAELFGSNLEWVWNGNGVWDPDRSALNETLVGMAQNMGAKVFRFPGGIFADFYRWRNGIGPQQTRPGTETMPGGAWSVHHFGTDEALAFARAAGGELLITVNIATGTVEEAVAWVRHVNNGETRVRNWELGNENYVAGAAPHLIAATMTPARYAARAVQFARAMREADPNIRIGIIADENYAHSIPQSYPGWTEQVLAATANDIDFVSVHTGYAPAFDGAHDVNPRTVYSALVAAPTLIGEQLASLSRRIAAIAPSRAEKISIAVTEWGPYFSASPQSSLVDHTKTIGSAVFVASALKTFAENPGVMMANGFQFVDGAFMGWIGLRNSQYIAKPSYLAFQLLSQITGTDVVSTTTSAPVFDTPKVGWVDAAGPVPYLDVLATVSADRQKLFVVVVNKHFDRSIRAKVNLGNFQPSGTASVQTLTGTGVDAHTGTQLPANGAWAPQVAVDPYFRFAFGSPSEVSVTASTRTGVATVFEHTFAPASVTVLTVPAR